MAVRSRQVETKAFGKRTRKFVYNGKSRIATETSPKKDDDPVAPFRTSISALFVRSHDHEESLGICGQFSRAIIDSSEEKRGRGWGEGWGRGPRGLTYSYTQIFAPVISGPALAIGKSAGCYPP